LGRLFQKLAETGDVLVRVPGAGRAAGGRACFEWQLANSGLAIRGRLGTGETSNTGKSHMLHGSDDWGTVKIAYEKPSCIIR